MSGKIEITADKNGPVCILCFKGDVTSLSDEAINAAYAALDLGEKPRLVIDFTETRYINSAGIATLVGMVSSMTKKKGTLRFAGMAPHYRRVAQIVGITDYVAFYDTVADALADPA